MFWGLIMEPNKRYTQTVEKPFHVSSATLDISTADDKPIQVMLCYEGRNYLLCNLHKKQVSQVFLDLNFQEGTKISFTSNGSGHVHLTGYLIPEDIDESDEEEEEEEEEEGKDKVKSLEKLKALLDLPENGIDGSLSDSDNAVEEDEDEDEEGEDMELDDDDDDDDNDDDDDENEDEEEEEENDDEEEVEDEEEVKPKDKNNKQQKNQKQQKVANDKAVVNGKDTSQQMKNKKEQQDNKNKQAKVTQEKPETKQPKKTVLAGGIIVEDIKPGNGAPATKGKFISVYYVGKLKNGKKFDETSSGKGFKFRLGGGEVIKGWDIGIVGMKAGGKRRLIIPAAMGYGKKGSPPVIPGNSVLVFDVELKKVH